MWPRRTILLAVLGTLPLTSVAGAQDHDERAGTPGHVTAWEGDRRTLIQVDPCPVTREGAWDYEACGARLRAVVERRLCAKREREERVWFFQVGAGPMIALTTPRCR